ncbi:MAG: carbohydrate-binding domain-containing protein [Prevotella sp.]|nr:carbohydrate-binding domain-containing protein [Prevotella sp.]
MTKNILSLIALISSFALMIGCSNDDPVSDWSDWTSDTGGNGGSSQTSGTSYTGEVATFDVSIDTSTLAETEGEIPADDDDYVENTTFTQSLSIVYDGTTATCDKTIDNVTVTMDGADVTINSLTDEKVSYTISGTTTDGSLKIYSSKKFQLVLNGVSITNPTAAAINIQSSKRAYVVLADGTTNTLTDGSSYTDVTDGEDMKACFFSEGQLCFSGSGKLNVYANCKAGIRSDDYVMIRPNTNIYVKATAGNGIKGNDALYIYGGVINVETSALAAKALSTDGHMVISGGRTTAVTTGNATVEDNELTGSAGIKADSTLTITGGELYVKSTGNGGKGISTDMQTYIKGGTVRVITTGKTFSYGSDDSKAKGIKADGDIIISGGDVMVRTEGGEGSEGIESKGEMTIEGGQVQVKTYDDALNSKGNLYLNGGYVLAVASNNDAIDANKNLYINGGNIIALGGGAPENPLDAAEGYSIYVNGGNVIGMGGSTAQTASSSKQASIAYSASVSGQKIGLLDSEGNSMMYFEVPSTSQTAVYMTADGMTANQKYTLNYGVSVSGGTTWNGMNTTGTISGGSQLGELTASASVGQSMGGGGMNGGGQGMGGRGPGGW